MILGGCDLYYLRTEAYVMPMQTSACHCKFEKPLLQKLQRAMALIT